MTMRSHNACLLATVSVLALSTAAHAQSISIPAQTITLPNGSLTFPATTLPLSDTATSSSGASTGTLAFPALSATMSDSTTVKTTAQNAAISYAPKSTSACSLTGDQVSITSPANNTTETAAFTVEGCAGPSIVNVAGYDSTYSTKLCPDAVPGKTGAWSVTCTPPSGTANGTYTFGLAGFYKVGSGYGQTNVSLPVNWQGGTPPPSGSCYSTPITGSSSCSLQSGWGLILDDEFQGTSLNTTNWSVESGSDPVYNLSGITLTPPSVSGGALHMPVNNVSGLHSSWILSNVNMSAQPVYMEAMIQNYASVQGVSNVFWTNNNGNYPEVDVTETYQVPSNDDTTMTYHSASGSQGGCSYSSTVDLTAGYHLYAAYWTASQVNWYVDGVQVCQEPAAALPTTATFAGMLNATFDTTSPTGSVNGNMNVQFVHVYQPGGSVTPQSTYCGVGAKANNCGTVGSAPVNTALPAVTPTTPVVGTMETVTNGTWTGSPTSIGYQWSYGDTQANISGATSSTYTPVGGDIGHTLVATDTATNSYGHASAASVPTAAVAGSSGPTPPPQAAAAGYHTLAFDEEFTQAPSLSSIISSSTTANGSPFYWEGGYGEPTCLEGGSNYSLSGNTGINFAMPTSQANCLGIASQPYALNGTQVGGFNQKFGYWEVYAQMPTYQVHGNPLWGKPWFYESNCTTGLCYEMDIAEGGTDGTSNSSKGTWWGTTIHDYTVGGTDPYCQWGGYFANSRNLTGSFHTYGLLWTPSTVTMYLDNAVNNMNVSGDNQTEGPSGPWTCSITGSPTLSNPSYGMPVIIDVEGSSGGSPPATNTYVQWVRVWTAP